MVPQMTSEPRAYVIWSFEHDAWWRPGGWGYTRDLAEAGHFTEADADQIIADANVVAVNEVVMLLPTAQATGPPRYSVVAEHDPHGGAGWSIYDREQKRIHGGWFADRSAADQTAAVLNRNAHD